MIYANFWIIIIRHKIYVFYTYILRVSCFMFHFDFLMCQNGGSKFYIFINNIY